MNLGKVRNFSLLRKLGKGGFGTVYEASSEGQTFALKKIDLDNWTRE